MYIVTVCGVPFHVDSCYTAALPRSASLSEGKVSRAVSATSSLVCRPHGAFTRAQAAEMIETGVLQTSWSQTGNFMAAISGRGVLEVAGHVGNSIYIRKSRAPEKKDAAQVPKKEVPSSGTVTGTNADLRRLSMDAAATILRRLGVQDDEGEQRCKWGERNCPKCAPAPDGSPGRTAVWNPRDVGFESPVKVDQ